MTADIAQYVKIAHELAEISQPIIQRYFRTPLAVDNKDDGTPVTMADCAAELAMRDHLTKFYPAHGIYGEEYGSSKLDHNPLWVLDPIDGTAAFSTGLPVFGTLIAALWDHRPLVGLINQPIMGERWVGCQGEHRLGNQNIDPQNREFGGYSVCHDDRRVYNARNRQAIAFSKLYAVHWRDCWPVVCGSEFIDPVRKRFKTLFFLALVDYCGG